MSSPRLINVIVFSDFASLPISLSPLTLTLSTQICPYTFIGHAALMSAIEECKSESLPLKFQVEYKPIRLSCQLPEDFSVDRRSYFTKKFGEKYTTAFEMVQAMGKSLGLEMLVNPLPLPNILTNYNPQRTGRSVKPDYPCSPSRNESLRYRR